MLCILLNAISISIYTNSENALVCSLVAHNTIYCPLSRIPKVQTNLILFIYNITEYSIKKKSNYLQIDQIYISVLFSFFINSCITPKTFCPKEYCERWV